MLLPALDEVDPGTKHSAAEMIGPFFASISAQDGTYDANGHLLRFPTSTGENSIPTLPCQTLITNPDAGRIATCENLQDALKTIFGGRP